MARPLRIEYPGAWYHVLNRGRRREKIFFSDNDHRYFLSLLGKCTARFGMEVHAYCLMPNHYHLIIRTPLGNLSRIMRHLDGVYTQAINRQYKYEGSLFRGRFKAILIEQDEYLLELVRYIHRNPLKAKLEQSLGQHRWTSHRAYMKPKERPSWLIVNGVLERFSRYEKESLKELDLFVRKEPQRALEKQLDNMRWPAVLGGDVFKEDVKKMLLGKEIDWSAVPDYKEYNTKISADELVKRVIDQWPADGEFLKKKRNQTFQLLKRAITYVACKDLQLSAREIGLALGGISRAVITRQYSVACCDLEKKTGCFLHIKKIRRFF